MRVLRTTMTGAITALMLLLSACSLQPPLPPYDEVKSDALQLMDEVAANFPEPVDIISNEDLEPSPCGSDKNRVNFYVTRQIRFERNVDVTPFLDKILDSYLTKRWQEFDVVQGETYRNVSMINPDNRQIIGITGSSPNEPPSVYIVITSACGAAPPVESD